jgi:hypothetical protein
MNFEREKVYFDTQLLWATAHHDRGTWHSKTEAG